MSLATSTAAEASSLPNPPAARRVRAPRATSRPDAKVATRARKVSFYLSAEAIKRLGIAATMADSDKSKVLEQVIAESPSLRRWVVSDRARAPEPAMSEVSSD